MKLTRTCDSICAQPSPFLFSVQLLPRREPRAAELPIYKGNHVDWQDSINLSFLKQLNSCPYSGGITHKLCNSLTKARPHHSPPLASPQTRAAIPFLPGSRESLTRWFLTIYQGEIARSRISGCRTSNLEAQIPRCAKVEEESVDKEWDSRFGVAMRDGVFSRGWGQSRDRPQY
jgi:hypothetical protein